MSATIIDLTAERIARRGATGPDHANPAPEGARVLVLARHRARRTAGRHRGPRPVCGIRTRSVAARPVRPAGSTRGESR